MEGDNLTVHLSPDEKTGRLGISMALAYEVPANGGEMELRIADFPPVRFTIGPKDEHDQHEPQP